MGSEDDYDENTFIEICRNLEHKFFKVGSVIMKEG